MKDYKFGTLYFEHSDGRRDVCGVNIREDKAVRAALDELGIRNPRYVSYYQRVFNNDAGETYIDVGSHTEFYVWKEDRK